jgi:hypothetical protein
MSVVEYGNDLFTVEDFYYNDKEHYIKIYYKGNHNSRLIQGVKCIAFYDNGIVRLRLYKEGENEKT